MRKQVETVRRVTRCHKVLAWPDAGHANTLLIGPRSRGLCLRDDQRLTAEPTEIDAELARDPLHSAVRLPHGRLALGTLRGGVCWLDAHGRWHRRRDYAAGPLDSTVTALLPDRAGGLWPALNRGLALVARLRALLRFAERPGFRIQPPWYRSNWAYAASCEAIDQCADGRAGVISIAPGSIQQAFAGEIRDNGGGMDAATYARVVEPFLTTKEVGKGTGLGLAIVFGIVKDHDRTIELDSTPGVGTRFVVRLPLDRWASVPAESQV